MRTRPDPASPWGQRLWFENDEFDAMMDEARQRSGSVPLVGGTGVDVEGILERVYGVVPDYGELPEGVLGMTHFHPDGRYEAFVSRELSDNAETDLVARRRLRTTLAHECAHIVMHGHLHLVDLATPSLFGDPVRPLPKVLCRQESVGVYGGGESGYDGQWWEYQANRGMASLLLPRRETVEYLRSLLEARGLGSVREALRAAQADSVIREVMAQFDVSMQVVVYRLQELGTLPKEIGQSEFDM